MSYRTLSHFLEDIRQNRTLPAARRLTAAAKRLGGTAHAALIAPWLAPLGGACARLVARLLAKLGDTRAARAATRRLSLIRAAVAQAAHRIERRRIETRDRANAFAEKSRAACRKAGGAAYRAVVDAVRAPLRDPRGSAVAVWTGAQAAYRATMARLRRMNAVDATVAGLFTLALLGPLAAPNLGADATIALTRHNPLADRVMVQAERDVSVAGPETGTVWTGVEYAKAERAAAPDWVLASGVDLGPLSPADALASQPRLVELESAPLWSPDLERASVAAADGSEYASLETASVPRGVRGPSGPMKQREIAALELGAFDTGPTAASVGRAEAAPAARPGALAAGDYATASVTAANPRAAWPASRSEDAVADLPTALAEALNLDGPGANSLPPKFAPIPSMRPTRSGPKRTARITVVLTAVGLNETASRAALTKLPTAVAFAIAPVAKQPEAWVKAARSEGRIALLEIPMEPVSYPRVNPGPLTLLAESSATDNLSRLAKALEAAPEVDGVATYLGGRFASVRDAVAPVLSDLKKRNLFMLETNPGPLSHLRRSAAEIGLPAASSVVSLDKSGRSTDLAEGFARLEEAAKARGHAIGVAVAVPGSIDAIAAWARELEKRGFRLTALAL